MSVKGNRRRAPASPLGKRWSPTLLSQARPRRSEIYIQRFNDDQADDRVRAAMSG
jgi:hypothetical protein